MSCECGRWGWIVIGKRRAWALLSLGWACVAACERTAPAEPLSWTRSDSGGSVLVVVVGNGHAVERWESRSSTWSERDWVGLDAASFLPDGRAIAVDRIAGEVVFLGPALEVEAVVGRRGKGPGEFSRIESVWTSADTAIVFDSGNQRISWLLPNGVVRELSTAGAGPRMVLAAGDGGYWLGRRDQQPFAEGTYRPSWILIDPTNGEDLPIRFPGDEYALTSRDGRLLVSSVPFGRRTSFSASGRHVAVAVGGEPGVGIWRIPDNRPAIVFRPPFEDRAVTDQDVDEWIDQLARDVPKGSDLYNRIAAAQKSRLTYEHHARFDAVVLQDSASVWLRRPSLDPRLERWWFFDLFGKESFRIDLYGRLLAASQGVLLVAGVDAEGTPQLSLVTIAES